ncbi:MAG: sodium-extruding oxaloacetate decarboxylase subunit alpha [Proteobacteria bacterium]|nr:sodium-extruding oxaloacetate decarboxylase subunit alpha [Pseudomonadota bacterium]
MPEVPIVKKKLGITELVLRDGHQSLLATRMRLDDMLPIAEKLDQIGYWSVESWGGATFDSCIRYLGEDPWERIRKIKEVMPNTPQQMLFRGQNILGYRHYADDVVKKFVERAAINGIDVFRVFDAMNDPRNFATAIKAVLDNDKHAQAAISYTTSPVHTLDSWLELAAQLQDMGAHSICIKDMAGLLKPYDAYKLVSRLKNELEVPIHLHSHATTGLSTATILKAIEAGVDNVDTSISSMSMTYGHSATEAIVAMMEDENSTGLDLLKLEDIADYFRQIRKKYAKFEGSLKGIDSRILVAQVPGGMLTNMENQLKQQGASEQFDEVLYEIPKVRADLGYIPLVTPTSQIVGTQAVLNVLNGERYKIVTNETKGILKGEYGATPATVNKELQMQVLEGSDAITCRPADNIAAELEQLTKELNSKAIVKKITLAENEIEDVLIYALFPQVGLNFLENRNNPDAFEAVPSIEDSSNLASSSTNPHSKTTPNIYTVTVDGTSYTVQVDEGGEVSNISKPAASAKSNDESIDAPLSGTIFKVLVTEGQQFNEGDVLIILEAMKMETEIRASQSGAIISINIKEGDTVIVGDSLLSVIY